MAGSRRPGDFDFTNFFILNKPPSRRSSDQDKQNDNNPIY